MSLPGAAGSLCTHLGTRATRRGRARAPAGPAAAVPTSGRAARASLAPAALRTPVWPAPAMPRARLPPPGGPPVPAPASLAPAAAGGAFAPARCVPRAPRAMLRAPGPHRPPALALPPRALLFHPGDPRDVLPPRLARVGEQCWPPSRGSGEIGHEEACRPPPPPGRMRAGVRRRCSHASCRCRARPCSCSAMSTLAAKNGRARSPAHRRPPSGTSALQRSLGAPLQEAPYRHVALQQPRGLPQDLRALAEREAHPPQLMVGGRRKGPA